MNINELREYEVKSSWWASFIFWDWGQNLVSAYFAWKVHRKYGRMLKVDGVYEGFIGIDPGHKDGDSMGLWIPSRCEIIDIETVSGDRYRVASDDLQNLCDSLTSAEIQEIGDHQGKIPDRFVEYLYKNSLH